MRIRGILPVAFIATAGIAGLAALATLWLSSHQDCLPEINANPHFFATPGSGPGSQRFQAASALPTSSSTPYVVPTVSAGHVQVTFASNRSTISVPTGTVIDLQLDGYWGRPFSSDSRKLPLVSSMASCSGSVRASFRVQGSGWIQADTDIGGNGIGAADITFRLNVIALP